MLFPASKRALVMTSKCLSCIFIIYSLFFFIHALSTEKSQIKSNKKISPTIPLIRCESNSFKYIDYFFSLLLGIFANVKRIRKLGIL